MSSPRKQYIRVNVDTLQSPTKSSSQKFVQPKVDIQASAVRKTSMTVGHQYVAWPEPASKTQLMEHRLQMIEKKKELLLQQLEEMEKKKEEMKKKKYVEKQKLVKRSKSLPPPSLQKEEENRLAAIIRDKNDEVKYLESKVLEERFAAALKSTSKSSSRPASVSGRSVSGKSVGSERSFISDVSGNKKPRYATLTISKSMPSGNLAPNHFEKHLRRSSYRLTSSKPFNPSGNKNGREYHRPRPIIPTFQSENETAASGMLSPHHVAAGTPVEPLKVSFRRGGVSTTVSRSAVPAEAMRAIANAQESFVIRQKRAYDLDRQRRIKLALGSVGRLSSRTITSQNNISNFEPIKKRSKKSAKISKKTTKQERKAAPVKIPGETLTRRRELVEEIKPEVKKKKKIVKKKKSIQKVSNIVDVDFAGDVENRIESATASILAVIEGTIDENKESSKKNKKVKRKKH